MFSSIYKKIMSKVKPEKEPAGQTPPENLAGHIRPFQFNPEIHVVDSDGEIWLKPGVVPTETLVEEAQNGVHHID